MPRHRSKHRNLSRGIKGRLQGCGWQVRAQSVGASCHLACSSVTQASVILAYQSCDIGLTLASHIIQDFSGMGICRRSREPAALLHTAPHFGNEVIALHGWPLSKGSAQT